MSTHCDTEIWEDTTGSPQLFGMISRDRQERGDLYEKRQATERIFKSMKECRRLERHCVRGLEQIRLHSLMSALGYSSPVLIKTWTGQRDPAWMVG